MNYEPSNHELIVYKNTKSLSQYLNKNIDSYFDLRK